MAPGITISSANSRYGAIALLFCSAFLCGSLILWVTLSIAAYVDPLSDKHTQLWLLIIFITLMTMTSLVVDKHTKRFELLSCKNIFLLYLFLQFALWPAWVLWGGISSLTTFQITFKDLRYKSAVFGLECVLAGLASFYAGYYRRARSVPKMMALDNHPVHKHRLTVAITGYVVVGTVAFFMLMGTNGGFYHFVTDILRFQNEELSGKSVYDVGVQCFYIAFLLSLCASLKNWGYTVVSPILLVVTVLVGVASAYRPMAMQAVMTWFVLRHYVKRRYKLNVKIALIVIAGLTLNIGYVAFREGQGDVILSLERSDSISSIVFENFFGRFCGTESIARIVDVTEATGFTGAVPFVGTVIVFWIPRAFWAAKPTHFGVMSNLTFYPEIFGNTGETSGIVTTFIGSLYWIGGIPAIGVGMVLMGSLLGWADRMILVRRDVAALGLYAIIFAFACYINEIIVVVIDLMVGLLAWRLACTLGFSRSRLVVIPRLNNTPSSYQEIAKGDTDASE
jgi:hypothetical protein